jgi:nitroimidazol reductase NimA-like FMN-containing flavoprotein (pyridoxamine 5'-phosphate oxidase superfamily)
MRRKEREITDRTEIESVIRRSKVCRLALAEQNQPYVVPLCFGFKDNTLYFHSAVEGKKIDILRQNEKVCFEFDTDHEVVNREKACDWGMRYRSVIGFGKASLIQDPDEKSAALDIIMAHYSGSPGPYEFADKPLRSTTIIRVEVESMTGKSSGY